MKLLLTAIFGYLSWSNKSSSSSTTAILLQNDNDYDYDNDNDDVFYPLQQQQQQQQDNNHNHNKKGERPGLLPSASPLAGASSLNDTDDETKTTPMTSNGSSSTDNNSNDKMPKMASVSDPPNEASSLSSSSTSLWQALGSDISLSNTTTTTTTTTTTPTAATFAVSANGKVIVTLQNEDHDENENGRMLLLRLFRYHGMAATWMPRKSLRLLAQEEEAAAAETGSSSSRSSSTNSMLAVSRDGTHVVRVTTITKHKQQQQLLIQVLQYDPLNDSWDTNNVTTTATPPPSLKNRASTTTATATLRTATVKALALSEDAHVLAVLWRQQLSSSTTRATTTRRDILQIFHYNARRDQWDVAKDFVVSEGEERTTTTATATATATTTPTLAASSTGDRDSQLELSANGTMLVLHQQKQAGVGRIHVFQKDATTGDWNSVVDSSDGTSISLDRMLQLPHNVLVAAPSQEEEEDDSFASAFYNRPIMALASSFQVPVMAVTCGSVTGTNALLDSICVYKFNITSSQWYPVGQVSTLHDDTIESLALSSDGRTMVVMSISISSNGSDRTTMVRAFEYNETTGQWKNDIVDHYYVENATNMPLAPVAISGDGKRVVIHHGDCIRVVQKRSTRTSADITATSSADDPNDLQKTHAASQTTATVTPSMHQPGSRTIRPISPPTSSPTAQPGNDDSTPASTVVDVVVGDDDLSMLRHALASAGLIRVLRGTSAFTVFAPTNDAFYAMGDELLQKLLRPDYKVHLRLLLTLHVSRGKYPILLSDITDGLSLQTMVTPEEDLVAHITQIDSNDEGQLTTTTYLSGPSFGKSALVESDLLAGNGVVHKVDKVFLPAALTLSLWQDMQTSDGFQTFLELVVVAEMEKTLKSQELTLFGPSNFAMKSGLHRDIVARLRKTPTLARQVVQNHLVPGIWYHERLRDGLNLVSLAGQTLTLSVGSGPFPECQVNGSLLLVMDGIASNGLVHIIDAPLLSLQDE